MRSVRWLRLSEMTKTIALTCLICLLLPASVAPQQPAPLPPVKPSDFVNDKPSNCASRTAALDGITQKVPPDELIIVIARPGDGDTRSDLSRRRLYNVRAYWSQFPPAEYRRGAETIILAEGERFGGYGQLEFYVGGKLVWVDKVARNADLRVGECYPPDDSYIRNGVFDLCEVRGNRIFYPCRDLMPRRKRKR
jgi:hypothetical protein